MEKKICAECLLTSEPVLVPKQKGNEKVFTLNTNEHKYEEYLIKDIIEDLKEYLTVEQYENSIHLITNWRDTNVLHTLMSTTVSHNPNIHDDKHKRLWNIYTEWIFKTMTKEVENYEQYKGMTTPRDGWKSNVKRPYYWGCMIDGIIFDYGYTGGKSFETLIKGETTEYYNSLLMNELKG